MQQAQSSSEGRGEAELVDKPKRQVQDLQRQNTEQQQLPTLQQDHRAVDEQERNVKGQDHLLNIVLIGDDGVGKSCISAQYSEDSFKSAYTPTVGTGFVHQTLELKGKRIKLNIWDTSGQERFRAFSFVYYRKAAGVVLVYDITNHRSFDNTLKWLADVEKNAPANVQKILVGNKCDLKHIRVVSEEEGREYAFQHSMPFCETSAKTGHNVNMVFEVLTEAILENLPPESPLNPESHAERSLLQLPERECKTGGCLVS